MANKVFKNPVDQAASLNFPTKPVTKALLDKEVRNLFKNRQEGLDYINANFEDGPERENALRRLGRVYPSDPIALDRAKFKSVYDKASQDFPNDWGNKIDYIKQELGLEVPESIADLYLRGNKLYGLQTREKGEPYEVELYNLQ